MTEKQIRPQFQYIFKKYILIWTRYGAENKMRQDETRCTHISWIIPLLSQMNMCEMDSTSNQCFGGRTKMEINMSSSHEKGEKRGEWGRERGVVSREEGDDGGTSDCKEGGWRRSDGWGMSSKMIQYRRERDYLQSTLVLFMRLDVLVDPSWTRKICA